MGSLENLYYDETFINEKADELAIERFESTFSHLYEKADAINKILETQLLSHKIDDEDLFTEAENLASKISDVINSIIKKIKDTISTILEKLTDAINKVGSKHLTPEEYFASDTSERRFECDIQKYTQECDKTLNEGQKLLRQIGSSFNVPDEKIRTFEKLVEKTKNTVKPVALPAAVAFGLLIGTKKIVSSWNSIISEGEKEHGSVYKSRNAEQYRESLKKGMKKDEQKKAVLVSMFELISDEKRKNMSFFQKLYTKEVVRYKMTYKN